MALPSKISTSQVSFGATPTLIVQARANRARLALFIEGGTPVLGDSSVTQSTGFPPIPIETDNNTAFSISYTGAIYGVSSGGQCTAFVIELHS